MVAGKVTRKVVKQTVMTTVLPLKAYSYAPLRPTPMRP